MTAIHCVLGYNQPSDSSLDAFFGGVDVAINVGIVGRVFTAHIFRVHITWNVRNGLYTRECEFYGESGSVFRMSHPGSCKFEYALDSSGQRVEPVSLILTFQKE
jgi:hypothetical protein